MIDNSYILGLFGQSGFTTGLGASTGMQTPKPKAQPTPPWDTTRQTPQSDLLRAALAGRSLINEDAARLDMAGASADYGKLFTLYQGLASLAALADQAGSSGSSLPRRRFRWRTNDSRPDYRKCPAGWRRRALTPFPWFRAHPVPCPRARRA